MTAIYSPAIETVSSSLCSSSAASDFSLVVCVFRFLSSAVYSHASAFFSYLLLLCHLDSSAAYGSCHSVVIAMCHLAATKKGHLLFKIQNIPNKFSKTRAPTPLCLLYKGI